MPREKLTPLYVLFYVLFSPDTYRVLAGIVCGAVLMPKLLPQETTVLGKYVLFLMLFCIGWAASGVPARWIAGRLQSLVSGK